MKSLSRVQLFATPGRTVAYQPPLSMEFSRQEYCNGLPFPSAEDLPNPGIELGSPALQADALPSEPPGKSQIEAMTGLVFVSICFLTRHGHSLPCVLGPVVAQMVKKSVCNVGNPGSIPGLGRSPGQGHGNPFQYSCHVESPWAEKPGGLQSKGSQRIGHN